MSNERDCDLPCRLIYVIGMPSGGTSCTAGILTKNGFWNENQGGFFEGRSAYSFAAVGHKQTNGAFSRSPLPVTDAMRTKAAKTALAYKEKAIAAGYDMAVMKAPSVALWMPDIFQQNRLNVSVEPLLVYRDPHECGRSIERRFKQRKPHNVAKDGQAQVLALQDKYDWPMWRFGRDADVGELEHLLGVELPVPWFDASRIVG